MNLNRIERGLIVIRSILWNKIKFVVLGIKFGKGLKTCGNVQVNNSGIKESINIGQCVTINSHPKANPIGGQARTILYTTSTGHINIGNRVGISNTAICSAMSITIEDDVCIGANCKIYDSDFHSIKAEERLNGNLNVRSAPVILRKKAFIGAHSIILKGVIIGEEAVIAAGSVVTHNVPDKEMWGGVPAVFIKKI